MSKKTILLIDDSSTVCAATGMLLRDFDVQLVTARSGEEGLASALGERPDLILLDVQMPGWDGFETCRRLREHRELQRVPVVLASAERGPEQLAAGREAGCNDFVVKPFNRESLAALLSTWAGDGEAV